MRKVFWLLVSIVVVPVSGILYQKLGALTDRRRHMLRGGLVPTAAGAVYLCEMGTEADAGPTVIFESGIGATSQNWLVLQRAVARHSRAISYDRAGLGWSTARESHPTPESLARHLGEILTAARIPGPYLLVGHSFGGLVAREFAARNPDQVTGVVLVDPMRPEEWPPLNAEAMVALNRAITLTHVGRIAASIGAARLFMRSVLVGSGRLANILCLPGGEAARTLKARMLCELGKMPREVWPAIVANWSRPLFYRTLEAYLHAIPATVTQMSTAPALEMPVAVLTPATATPLSAQQLQAIGSNTHQIIAHSSAHWVHLDEPQLVLAAIDSIRTATQGRASELRESATVS